MKEAESTAQGFLRQGEPHPCAQLALHWIKGLPPEDLSTALGAFSSCAIEGNRLGEICAETLRRLLSGETVGDRYLLGLAWALHASSPQVDSVTFPEQSIKDALNALYWAKPSCDRSVRALVEKGIKALEARNG